MDRAYIDSHNLIDKYARGKLSGNDLEEFEIYMLEHPEVVNDIEFAKGMQDALDESKDSLVAGSVNTASADRTGGFWFGKRYAVAATVLLGISAMFSTSLSLKNANLRKEIGNLRYPQIISHELWLEPVRGAANHVLERGGDFAAIIHADIGSTESESYSVELKDQQSSFSWAKSGLVPDADRMVTIFVRAAPAGRYSLRIFSDPDRIESASYQLSIIDQIK